MSHLRIGTRGSQLALYQAHTTKQLLETQAGVTCEIVVIRTTGDRLSEAKLSAIGGKRLFVKEIEDALLDRTIDLAVHSSKDMPAVLPDGLAIGAVLAREDARDAVVLPAAPRQPLTSLEDVVAHLGQEPRIGTSSVRRTAQLTRLFPSARFLSVRGNLDTRLRKVDSGEFDAIVLAAAGLRRLEHGNRISATLPISACVPAPGQGIIALEMRTDDNRVREKLATIDDHQSALALIAERAVVRRLGGGCQMPIGAYANFVNGNLEVTGVVISLDGARAVRAEATAPADTALGTVASAQAAETLGVTLAERLLEQGAGEILADVERAQGAVEGIQP